LFANFYPKPFCQAKTKSNMNCHSASIFAFTVAFVVFMALPTAHGYLAKCGDQLRIATGDSAQKIMEEMRACHNRGLGICIELRAEEVQKLSDSCMQYTRGGSGLDVARFCQGAQCARATYTERGSNTPTYVYRVCSPYNRNEMYPELREAVQRSCLREYSPTGRTDDNSLLRQFYDGMSIWDGWSAPRETGGSARYSGETGIATRG